MVKSLKKGERTNEKSQVEDDELTMSSPPNEEDQDLRNKKKRKSKSPTKNRYESPDKQEIVKLPQVHQESKGIQAFHTPMASINPEVKSIARKSSLRK